MILPMTVRSGRTPVSPCTPPGPTRKPADDLVEDRAARRCRSAPFAQVLEEALGRRHEAHVRRVGLGEERGELVRGERLVERGGVVPRHDDRAGRDLGRHARRRRDALRREAAAGVGEQAVDVAVVGAGELQQLRAAGHRAGEPDRAHRRLGARRRHPQHLHARHAAADLLGEVDLAGGRCAERRALRGGLDDRRDDVRVRVAVDERAPRADPVDVAVVVDVDELGALGAVDEDRVAADRAHRADRRVHRRRAGRRAPARSARPSACR